MKNVAIGLLMALSFSAYACKSGFYLYMNKTQTSLWFESEEACKRGARQLNLIANAYKCISTK